MVGASYHHRSGRLGDTCGRTWLGCPGRSQEDSCSGTDPTASWRQSSLCKSGSCCSQALRTARRMGRNSGTAWWLCPRSDWRGGRKARRGGAEGELEDLDQGSAVRAVKLRLPPWTHCCLSSLSGIYIKNKCGLVLFFLIKFARPGPKPLITDRSCGFTNSQPPKHRHFPNVQQLNHPTIIHLRLFAFKGFFF